MPFTGPFPGTFTQVTSEILVSYTVFSGSVVNNGVVGSAGIVVISRTFTAGGITDCDNAGGITIDSHSKVNGGFSDAVPLDFLFSVAAGLVYCLQRQEGACVVAAAEGLLAATGTRCGHA